MTVEDEAPRTVFDRFRVVEFSSYLAGPYCGALLGDLGAEVVKVEQAGRGDGARGWGSIAGLDDLSPMFVAQNRGKTTVTLDLKEAGGRHQARELVRSADVVIESFTPRAARELGLDRESINELNPQVVHCTISAYGCNNSRSDIGGFDGILQAYSGIMFLVGADGSPVARVPVSAIDYLTGAHAFGGIMAALLAHPSTGGQHIDVSLFDAAVSMLGPIVVAASSETYKSVRSGGEMPYAAPYGLFETSDSVVSLGIGNDGAWRRFCRCVGLDAHAGPDSSFATNAGRLANRTAVDGLVANALAQFDTRELVELLDEALIPVAEVRPPEAMVRDPFTAERQAVHEITVEGTQLLVPSSPLRLSKTPTRPVSPPPRLP